MVVSLSLLLMSQLVVSVPGFFHPTNTSFFRPPPTSSGFLSYLRPHVKKQSTRLIRSRSASSLKQRRSPESQVGRNERAFGPARGPFRTGPDGPGPVAKLVGPGCNIGPEKMSVRSGL